MHDFAEEEMREFIDWYKNAPREVITLSKEGFKQLLERLEKLPEPNEKLIEAVCCLPPWEKKS